jgi:diguanylate cyclase (GGDEF)-like protein
MQLQDSRKILVVDDDPDIVWMITSVLRKDFEVISAADGKRAVEALQAEAVCGIIADHMMPGMSGVELLDRAQELQPAAARVLVTASDRVNVLKDAVNQARVHRFLSKPLRLGELPTLMSDAIREARLEVVNQQLVAELSVKNEQLNRSNERLEALVKERTAELEQAVTELRQLALRDGLTGLFNHRHFQESMEAEFGRAVRHGHPLGLLFIDVDHFKRYNDQNGHPAGDRLLRRIADVLAGGRESGIPRQVRLSDVIARYGGEEFVMLLPETDLAGSLIKAERVRQAISNYEFEHGATQPLGKVSVSIGVACYPDHASTKQDLIAEADRQLYRAKAEGRNRTCAAGGAETPQT